MGKKIVDNRVIPAVQNAVKRLEEHGKITKEVKQQLASIDFAVEDYFHKDGKVKRPMNCFLVYGQYRRGELAQDDQYKGLTTGKISKILKDEYRNMTDEEQHVYRYKAKIIKTVHETLFPEYKYQRRPNGSKKKGSKKKGMVHPEEDVNITSQPFDRVENGYNVHEYSGADFGAALPAQIQDQYLGPNRIIPYMNGYYLVPQVPVQAQFQNQNQGEYVTSVEPASNYDRQVSATPGPTAANPDQPEIEHHGEYVASGDPTNYYGYDFEPAPDVTYDVAVALVESQQVIEKNQNPTAYVATDTEANAHWQEEVLPNFLQYL